MSPAAAALAALLAAIVISCTSRVNVGLIAVGLAWALGLYTGRSADVVLAGFPASLFVTLAGVTLLFSLAETNGTIELLANRLVHAARGSARVVPVLIFAIAGVISMLGPGAIASVALVAPLAMAIGNRTGLPPFLTALMVANGANAGNLSPLSAVGVIANARMAAAGLGAHEWKVFAANFLAHVLVSIVPFMVLVPRRGRGRRRGASRSSGSADAEPTAHAGDRPALGRLRGGAQGADRAGRFRRRRRDRGAPRRGGDRRRSSGCRGRRS